MLCDICGKNQATVHLTEIIDEQMNELHLCEECARTKSEAMEQQFGLSDLLAGMVDFQKSSSNKEEEIVNTKCPACGLSYADFKKIGRLGCGECYNVFRKYLAPLLKRIHGSNQHIGKSPSRVPLKIKTVFSKVNKKKIDLDELKKQLQNAIQKEAFEEAARLRDQIKEIEAKSNKEKNAD
ncbi:MAG: UvrB/UvrC motif-containing protein [Candidatus Omnitrophota bacterium]|nr:UvrB/UvrC motif-containing protein [Candidatus Omnitrophota bacterium]